MDEQKIQEIEIDLLQPNPLQPRGLITSESIRELVESIKTHGILEPLVVAKTPAGYQIIAGERRWRAAKLAGLKKIPVVLRETTPRGMLEMAIVENVQREDLNPLERGEAYRRLNEEFGMSILEISRRVGKSSSFICNSIRLLSLPDALKDGLISGTTTEGHVRALVAIEDPKLMIEAYKMLLKEEGNVRRAEEIAREIRAEGEKTFVYKRTKIHSEELEKMREKIAALLDARVEINQSTVAASISISLRGNLEKTTQTLKRIYRSLCSEAF